MNATQRLVSIVATCVLLAPALSAPGAEAGRRPPPSAYFCTTQFSGKFVGDSIAARSSSVYLCPGDSATLVSFVGIVPATCRDANGRTHGPAKGVGVQFNTLPRTPIGPGGSFAFTARSPEGRILGAQKATVRVTGTFNGTTVTGRVRIQAGPGGFGYTGCTGDARFQARLDRG